MNASYVIGAGVLSEPCNSWDFICVISLQLKWMQFVQIGNESFIFMAAKQFRTIRIQFLWR